MVHKSTRYVLAAVQAIIGWEWVMSGGNKLLAGNFPQSLGAALANGIDGNPNGWYVRFLQSFVLPNSVFFGYLIEWSEVIIGVVLLTGVCVLLSRPRFRGDPQYRLAIGYSIAVMLVAALGAIQNINFHFWMGGWVIPTFNPTAPYNEGVDLDGLLPPLSLVIIIAQLALLREVQGYWLLSPLLHRLRDRKVKRTVEA